MERDYDFDSRTYYEDLEARRRSDAGPVKELCAVSTRTSFRPVPRTSFMNRALPASILGHLVGAINGAAIARKTSFLKDRMGEAVFAPGIQVVDDPFKRRGAATRPFDGEGTRAERLDVIEDGVLRHWFLDGASARELGLTPNGRAHRSGSVTSPGATNVTLMPGEKSLEELMAEAGQGLLVTDLIGHGVNGLTGDYSRGQPVLVRKRPDRGSRQRNHHCSNLKDMFARLVPGSDLDKPLFGSHSLGHD